MIHFVESRMCKAKACMSHSSETDYIVQSECTCLVTYDGLGLGQKDHSKGTRGLALKLAVKGQTTFNNSDQFNQFTIRVFFCKNWSFKIFLELYRISGVFIYSI